MVIPEAGKLLEPTQLSGLVECDITRILQCDRADLSVNSDESSDISVNSEYLPFSNQNLHDDTLNEDDDNTQNEDDDNTQNEDDYNTQNEDDDNTNLSQNWNARTSNITIKRNTNFLLASQLPTIFVTNHTQLVHQCS